jgi:hypothetical protein
MSAKNPLDRLKTYALETDAERPSDTDLARLEDDLGGRLPTAYRRFLLTSAPLGIEGGAVFPTDDGGRGRISTFFGLGGGPERDIRQLTFETYPGRIPDETVPIGENGQNSDLVLLVFDGARRGWIATWDHEHHELAEGELARMSEDLAASGTDVNTLDDHAVIHAWEHAHADELGRPPLWGNLRVAAHSFRDFLDLLEPDPDYA